MADNSEGRYYLMRDAVQIERWFAKEFIDRLERITRAVESMAAKHQPPKDGT